MAKRKAKRMTAVQAAARKPLKLVIVRDDYGPTPETKRKLRPDAIETLWKRGILGTHEWGAASEIRSIVEQIAGRFVRSPAGKLELLGGRVQTSPHPLDGVPVNLQRRYMHRYIPWTRKMAMQRCGLATYLEIAFAVLIDGRTLNQVDRQWGLRHGRACEALIAALRSY